MKDESIFSAKIASSLLKLEHNSTIKVRKQLLLACIILKES